MATQEAFPHELWLKFDALINPNGTEHHILQITQYYDYRYIVLVCDQDDGAAIQALLIKLDVNRHPFLEETFGHWTF